MRFLQEHAREAGDSPFFMYVAYTAAHWPMHALEKDIAKYKGKFDRGYEPMRRERFDRMKQLRFVHPRWELSPTAIAWNEVELKDWEKRCMEVYAAMVDNLDQGIGRISKQLQQNGAFENTLIFFLQDNGGCAEDMGRKSPTDQPLAPPQPFGPDDLQHKVWPPALAAGRHRAQ